MREHDKHRLNLLILRIAIFSVVSILLTVAMLAVPTTSSAAVAVGVSVAIAPPALPVYTQPPCPGPGYIWTPGYWAWDADTGYYWVPGAWVTAPFVGALWTPGYWGWSGGAFLWHAGYWGPVVGFYGGINYGFGYTGIGYEGGRWENGAFYYNRAVNNVDVTRVTNVYEKKVVVNNVTRVSYNGGKGGITARPTAEQLAAEREKHVAPTEAQIRNKEAARKDPKQRAAINHGRPAVAAVQKPGELSHGTAPARREGAPNKMEPSRRNVGQGTRTLGGEKQPSIATHQHAAPPARTERPVMEHPRPSERPGIASHPSGHAPQHPQSKNEKKQGSS